MRKGICWNAYLEQMLEDIVFLYYDSLTPDKQEELIFMEDGSKVYKGKAHLLKLEKGIRGFDWPPSSPNFKPIEKVWRCVKIKITKLEKFSTNKEDILEIL